MTSVTYGMRKLLCEVTYKKKMFLGSKVRLVRRADNLTAVYKPIV
jgi:hypothetical protein